jgi:hypothetical protein
MLDPSPRESKGNILLDFNHYDVRCIVRPDPFVPVFCILNLKHAGVRFLMKYKSAIPLTIIILDLVKIIFFGNANVI